VASTRKKAVETHVIDGCHYKTIRDVERHEELKANPDVKSFHLPDAKEKSTYSRYGAHKCEINGIVFDSVLEGMYYAYLLELRRNKFLKKIERQVTFVLMEGFTHKATGKKVRPITYIADFVLTDNEGEKIVVDVKGKKTPEFRLKEKMFFQKYPDMEFVCVQWDNHEKEWRNLDDIEKDKRARKRAKVKSTSKKTKTVKKGVRRNSRVS